VTQQLLAGDVAGALASCEKCCPGIFARQGPNRDVYFQLLCQQFIERLRAGHDDTALAMAQKELAQFGVDDPAYLTELMVRPAYARVRGLRTVVLIAQRTVAAWCRRNGGRT